MYTALQQRLLKEGVTRHTPPAVSRSTCRAVHGQQQSAPLYTDHLMPLDPHEGSTQHARSSTLPQQRQQQTLNTVSRPSSQPILQ